MLNFINKRTRTLSKGKFIYPEKVNGKKNPLLSNFKTTAASKLDHRVLKTLFYFFIIHLVDQSIEKKKKKKRLNHSSLNTLHETSEFSTHSTVYYSILNKHSHSRVHGNNRCLPSQDIKISYGSMKLWNETKTRKEKENETKRWAHS